MSNGAMVWYNKLLGILALAAGVLYVGDCQCRDSNSRDKDHRRNITATVMETESDSDSLVKGFVNMKLRYNEGYIAVYGVIDSCNDEALALVRKNINDGIEDIIEDYEFFCSLDIIASETKNQLYNSVRNQLNRIDQAGLESSVQLRHPSVYTNN